MATISTHLRLTLHAVKKVICLFTGIGRSKSHYTEKNGLTLKHFAIGGIVAGLLLIAGLISLVRWIAGNV